MQAIGRAVENAVQNSNRGSLDHEIVPKFEKATKEMFSQIAQTFSKGTEDYMSRSVSKYIVFGLINIYFL